MEFRLLTKQELLDNYGSRMRFDFPPTELKPPELLSAAFDTGAYFARGLFDENGTMLAYAYFFSAGDYMLLDYFAVDRSLRGQGVGSKALEFIKEMPELSARKLLLEVEDPDFSADSADNDIRVRRISFYLHGGIADTGARSRVFGADYRLLCPQPISKEDALRGIGELYKSLLPTPIFEKNVVLK